MEFIAMNIEAIEEDAERMAGMVRDKFRWWMIYSITDNPWSINHRNKEHVIWHNAFYRARKEMNKKTM